MPLSFETTTAERKLVREIARRARKLHGPRGRRIRDVEMDLCATHASGCPLDFERLSQFDDFNLTHDVIGIENCLDRDTGELRRMFRPRCALPEVVTP